MPSEPPAHHSHGMRIGKKRSTLAIGYLFWFRPPAFHASRKALFVSDHRPSAFHASRMACLSAFHASRMACPSGGPPHPRGPPSPGPCRPRARDPGLGPRARAPGPGLGPRPPAPGAVSLILNPFFIIFHNFGSFFTKIIIFQLFGKKQPRKNFTRLVKFGWTGQQNCGGMGMGTFRWSMGPR